MASGSPARILRAPGRLVVQPTSLSLAYPHGGVEVGRTRAVVLTNAGTNYVVPCEGLGGDASDVLNGTNRFVMTCFLRGWDDDAVQYFMVDNWATGANTSRAMFSAPGAVEPGSSALDRALRVLYAPDDPDAVPAVLLHRAVPVWQEGAELAFQRGSELGIPLALECLRGADGRILDVGYLADLTF